MAARSGDELLQMVVQRWRWFAYRVRFHPITTQHAPRIADTLHDYARLMRLDKPAGIWLLLWPTLWALWISAAGQPDGRVFAIFVLGVVLMRSAGCVINDFADRDIDPHVERTRNRPIAARRISPGEAIALFAALSITALMLALHLNRLSILLACAGAAFTVTYPFFKRFFAVPQLYLGLSFGWGIPMAFAAQTEHVPRIAWLLFIANIAWCAVYDTYYAMVDREDDIELGVRSSAILFGESDRHIIAVMQAMTLLSLAFVGRAAELGRWFWLGLSAGAAFFLYELYLIRRRDRAGCFAAFLHSHYFGMAVFIGIALDYLFGTT